MLSKRDLFSRMQSEFDRFFEEPGLLALRPSMLRARAFGEPTTWAPRIEVFEKNKRLVTRFDLPGMKKEDVKVEVADGQLVISGERKREFEEKEAEFYRSEWEYGSFYRAVPLPEGVKLEDVKATYADGVLEVSVPILQKAEEKPRQIKVEDAKKLEPVGA